MQYSDSDFPREKGTRGWLSQMPVPHGEFESVSWIYQPYPVGSVLGLHTFTRATNLGKWREKSLNFTTGTIIEFKYALFDLAAHEDGFTQETYADLFNINCDIILRVTIYSGQNKKKFSTVTRMKAFWMAEDKNKAGIWTLYIGVKRWAVQGSLLKSDQQAYSSLRSK